MKAILEINMPENCEECELFYEDRKDYASGLGGYCFYGKRLVRDIDSDSDIIGRHHDCPLKVKEGSIEIDKLSEKLATIEGLLQVLADGLSLRLKSIQNDIEMYLLKARKKPKLACKKCGEEL